MEKLFKIQCEIDALVKNQDNPYFKSKYFDVNQVIEHLKPLLEKYKLVVLQPLTNVDGKMALKTMVVDIDSPNADKSLLDYTVTLPDAPDAQKYGSAITYFRRYALQSLFLLQAEDDDGNKASTPIQPKKSFKKEQKELGDMAQVAYENEENPF